MMCNKIHALLFLNKQKDIIYCHVRTFVTLYIIFWTLYLYDLAVNLKLISGIATGYNRTCLKHTHLIGLICPSQSLHLSLYASFATPVLILSGKIGPRCKKPVFGGGGGGGVANNTGADQSSAQSDQRLCYSLFGKYRT